MEDESVTAAESGKPGQGRIEDDHRELRVTLGHLEQTTDLGLLLPQLEALHQLLEQHFRLEEGPQGFRSVIGESAPNLLNPLRHLFDEHRQMLATVHEITHKAKTCLEGPVSEVLRDVRVLSKRLLEHEAKETELLADSVYTDIGTSD